MENKKMPFAVFVLKWIENKVEDYKKNGLDEFNLLDDLINDCSFCPLSKECDHTWVGCKNKLKERVERAE